MIGTRHPLTVREGPLVQGDGPSQVTRYLVGDGEVKPRGQGVGMVAVQQLVVGVVGTLVVGDRADLPAQFLHRLRISGIIRAAFRGPPVPGFSNPYEPCSASLERPSAASGEVRLWSSFVTNSTILSPARSAMANRGKITRSNSDSTIV